MWNKINKLIDLCVFVEISEGKETFEDLFEFSQPWYKHFHMSGITWLSNLFISYFKPFAHGSI